MSEKLINVIEASLKLKFSQSNDKPGVGGVLEKRILDDRGRR